MESNLIDDVWIKSENAFNTKNPSHQNQSVGRYSVADEELVRQAVNASVSAFPAWSATGVQQRHNVLKTVAVLISENKDRLADLLAREEGKTLTEAVGETMRAAQIFDFYAGEALRLQDHSGPSTRPGIRVEVRREPVGVFALITPWNFPIAIPAWKIAPALCYGNCAVIKPSEVAPGCAVELVRLLRDAGLPAGVLNLVSGPGEPTGRALVESNGIDGVSFTGSVGTGSQIRQTAARRGIRCQTEMGGKNPIVILDDADLDQAVEGALNGAFFSTGQRCTASSRIIVTEGVYVAFKDRLLKRLSEMVVGDALGSDTTIGPVVNQSQKTSIERYLSLGWDEGNQLFPASKHPQNKPSLYLQPHLFEATDLSSPLVREEIFGPVASLIKATDFEDALRLANDTEFGLSAGIYTSSLKYASLFKARAQAGMVMVNLPTAGVDYHVPFGGIKQSSFGPREQGSNAVEFFTQVKTIYEAAI